MINIIDSFRNVVTDKYAIIKIFILTLPAIFCIYSIIAKNMVLAYTLNIIFCILFAAVFVETIRRSCNSEAQLLPDFAIPVRMFITLGLSLLASIPAIIVIALIYFLFFTTIITIPAVSTAMKDNLVSFYLIYAILHLICSSIYYASVTQFLDTGKIFDAYNPIKVVKAFPRFVVNIALYVIQAILINLVIGILPIYIIMFIGGMNQMNPVAIIYGSMLIVLNYLMFADYIGQTKKESEIY